MRPFLDRFIALSAAALFGLSAAACAPAAPKAGAPAEPAPSAKPAAIALSRPDDRPDFAPTVKPGAAVDVDYTITGLKNPDDTGQVTIRLRDEYDHGRMDVAFSTSPGLEIVNGAKTLSADMSGEAPHVVVLNVRAAKAGIYYIDMQIAVTGAEEIHPLRAISVRVPVGGAIGAAKPADPALTRDSAGRPIIIMPAKETVSQ